jgi:integrase
MRVLRALYNFANGQYEDDQGNGLFPHNPVDRITHNKQWNSETRRATRIADTDLKVWFDAVGKLDSKLAEVHHDLLIFLLLTGLRRREATELKWSDINFKDKSLTVRTTKNHRPITLPLSDYALELLEVAQEKRSGSTYVFHGMDLNLPLQEPRRQVKRVREISGVDFTLHDLRRTFISIAESLDISMYAIKALVNHGVSSGDITAGYVVWDIARLRKPMQLITDYILKCAGIKPSAQVIDIESKKI